MTLKTLPLVILIILSLISCKKENDNKIDNDKFYIKYGDEEFETKGGLLYLYDKIDNEYHYTIICGNINYIRGGWGINDTYSRDDYVKLHFIGDSITNLIGPYPIINDPNSFIIFDYNDTLNTYLIKDNIISGNINISSYTGIYPRTISFQGKTKLGKTISFNYFVSSPEVNYKLTRQIMGEFSFQNKKYELSDIYVYRDSFKYNIILKDFDMVDSLEIQIRFGLFKTDNDNFEGNYYGLDTIGPNSFHGIMGIYSYNRGNLYNRYFNQGDIYITKTEAEKYKIDFKLFTFDNDSINGYWEILLMR